jgi:2-polyprenyl-6-hydroxyphenyl methylase/3-demethylubiquinone-9 3-methyltransferase
MKKHVEDFITAANADTAARAIGSTPVCKLCGSASHAFCSVDFNKSCNNYPLRSSSVLVEYFKCNACELIYTDFFDGWTNDDFRSWVYNDDYILVDPDYAGIRSADNAVQFARILAPAKGALSVLDYGGGQGGFAHELRRHGFAQTLSYDPYGEHQDLADDTFDVVTAFEVVEHSTDPARTLDEILSKVKDDGLAIIGQSMQPDDIDQIRDRWWYIAPRNGHVTFYSHKTLLSYAQSRGVVYRSVGGWFVLHRPAVSDKAKRILEGLPAEIEFIDVGAPRAGAGQLGEWHDCESGTKPFRWTARPEMPLGKHSFRANRTALSIRYTMAIEAEFAQHCALRIGSETFPLRLESPGHLMAVIHLDEAADYHVTLVTPPPRRPSELGLNGDSRELGIAVFCEAEE